MIQFQLWAYTPGSDAATILPTPLSWQASFVLSDVGALQLTYPSAGVARPILDGYCDVELRYRLDDSDEWVCPPQGRFSILQWQDDPIAEATTPTRSYTATSYGWLLDHVLQEQTAGLDDQGSRSFTDAPGQIAVTLIGEAHTAGSVPGLSVVDLSTATGDPIGYGVGVQLSQILRTAADDGRIVWLMQPDSTGQGRQLTIYDDYGTDRSTGDDPVTLRGITSAPSTLSAANLASRVIVAGDSTYSTASNNLADQPYGALPTYVTASGLSAPAALAQVAQAALDAGTTRQAQHTRQFDFGRAPFLPLADFGLGDTILAPDETGAMAPMAVQQITLTYDGSSYGGNLVLGDRFTMHDLRLQRQLAALTGAASAISGNGAAMTPPVTPPAPGSPDQPAAPTLQTGLTMVIVSWSGKTTTGADFDRFDHADVQRDTTSAFSNPVVVGQISNVGTMLPDGPFTMGTRYYYRIIAYTAAGEASVPSASATIVVDGVRGPDLVVNSLTGNTALIGALTSVIVTTNSVNSVHITADDVVANVSISAPSISGGTIVGTSLTTSSSGTSVTISSSAASGSPGIGFYDSTYGGTGFIRMSGGSMNITTPVGSYTSGVMALSESGFSVSLRGGTVLSFSAPQGSGGSSITSGGGLSINAGGNLNLNGNVQISGSLSGGGVVTGSVVRPGDGISTSGSVSAGRLQTTNVPTTSGSPAGIGTGGTIVIVSSSRRNKKKIANLKKPERVLDLRPVRYQYRAEGVDRIGLIAEETAEILPELVYVGDDGRPESVMYQSVGVMLIPLVKDLLARLDAAEARIARLEEAA